MALFEFLEDPSPAWGARHDLGDDFLALSVSKVSLFFSSSNIFSFPCVIHYRRTLAKSHAAIVQPAPMKKPQTNQIRICPRLKEFMLLLLTLLA